MNKIVQGSRKATSCALCMIIISYVRIYHRRSKNEIRDYIERVYGYDLHKTWEEWHRCYYWQSSCQGTVPQAIICFFYIYYRPLHPAVLNVHRVVLRKNILLIVRKLASRTQCIFAIRTRE